MASDPRQISLRLLKQWEDGRGFAADLLDREFRRIEHEGSVRGKTQNLFYTVLRHQRLLDHWIASLADRKVDPLTRRVLRQGLTEGLLLDGPPHALVNEHVRSAGRARNLVNAVLRRALRERDALHRERESLPPPIRFSVPDFLWKRWVHEFGETEARALAEWNQEPAPVYLRVFHPAALEGPGVSGVSEVPGFPCHRRVAGPPDPEWFRRGDAYAQDPSATPATRLLQLETGQRILDACAAPGGKTLAIAAEMGADGTLVACDLPGNRLDKLKGNLRSYHLDERVQVCAVDWRDPTSIEAAGFETGSFDRILLDAPCSNTGVIRRRIDVPWRLSPADFDELPRLQLTLLHSLGPLLTRGGLMVYSTCSIDHVENEAVADAFLHDSSDRFEGLRQNRVLPWRDGLDGTFCAVFRRT